MDCPYCGNATRVIDSRPINDGVRRRRQCVGEGHRFTTHERLAPVEVRVIKADGASERYDPEKLERVVRRLAGADELPPDSLRRLVQRVGLKAEDLFGSTVRSYDLAMLLIDELRPVHPLAYHRFLANYTDPSGEMLPPPGDDGPPAATAPQLGLFPGGRGGEDEKDGPGGEAGGEKREEAV